MNEITFHEQRLEDGLGNRDGFPDLTHAYNDWIDWKLKRNETTHDLELHAANQPRQVVFETENDLLRFKDRMRKWESANEDLIGHAAIAEHELRISKDALIDAFPEQNKFFVVTDSGGNKVLIGKRWNDNLHGHQRVQIVTREYGDRDDPELFNAVVDFI